MMDYFIYDTKGHLSEKRLPLVSRLSVWDTAVGHLLRPIEDNPEIVLAGWLGRSFPEMHTRGAARSLQPSAGRSCSKANKEEAFPLTCRTHKSQVHI